MSAEFIIWFNRFTSRVYYKPIYLLLMFSMKHKKILYKFNLWRYEHTIGRLMFHFSHETQMKISKSICNFLSKFPPFHFNFNVQTFFSGRCSICGYPIKDMILFSVEPTKNDRSQDRVWHSRIFPEFCPSCFCLFGDTGTWKTKKGMDNHERFMEKKYKTFKKGLNEK